MIEFNLFLRREVALALGGMAAGTREPAGANALAVADLHEPKPVAMPDADLVRGVLTGMTQPAAEQQDLDMAGLYAGVAFDDRVDRVVALTEITADQQFAFAHADVTIVMAHTLGTPNASNNVLQKVGMTFVSEIVDPDDGPIWQWQIKRDEYNASRMNKGD